MRLMLGTPDTPILLVSVDDDFDPVHFKFRVINGGWDGVCTDGEIRVDNKYDNESVGPRVKILTEDQDRLRGHNSWDYQTVFENFDNPNYVGPVWKTPQWDDMDDDIAF